MMDSYHNECVYTQAEVDKLRAERDAALGRAEYAEAERDSAFKTISAVLTRAEKAEAELHVERHVGSEFRGTEKELASAQAVIDAAIKAIDSWLDIDGETYEEWEAALAAHLERYPREN